jgi:predicted RNase H-like nuclease
MLYDTDAASLSARAYLSFAELLEAYADAEAIGVDIPIGLSGGKPRQCDTAARRVLEQRRLSVFPAPDPRVLFEPTWWHAEARSRKLTGKGISRQSFAICRKVLEVNWLMQWERQDRVFETHPEVGFWALAGRVPMEFRKTWPEGYEERRELLADALGIPIWDREEARTLAGPAAPDDVLDATVAAWTARRFAEGRAERLPAEPPIDARGLRLEIVY